MVEFAATDLESCERVDGSPPGINSVDSSGFPPKPPAELALMDEESRSRLIKSVTCKICSFCSAQENITWKTYLRSEPVRADELQLDGHCLEQPRHGFHQEEGGRRVGVVSELLL